MKDVLAMVLAGGHGKRLLPLTRDRAKPAVGSLTSVSICSAVMRRAFAGGAQEEGLVLGPQE